MLLLLLLSMMMMTTMTMMMMSRLRHLASLFSNVSFDLVQTYTLFFSLTF